MIHRISCPSRPEFRPGTSGVRAVLFALVLGPWAIGCTPVAMPSSEPEPTQPSIPALEEGTLPAPMAEEAARILRQAARDLQSGALEEARNGARDIILHYPGADGSAEALGILARAALGLGDSEESAEASGRFLSILGPTHPIYPEILTLNASALLGLGDREGALRSLMRFPENAEAEDVRSAWVLLRTLVVRLGAPALRETLSETPEAHPFRGAVATELAVSLFLGGDSSEAEEWARIALAEELEPGDEALARGVLSGHLDEILGDALVLGAILPRTGVSPGMADYGELVLEGIQVAVEEYQSELRRSIRLEVMDHQGDPEESRISVQRLEDLGAVGAIGPLTLDFLDEAARARRAGLPLVSPFSALAPEESDGVFSLSGPDPGGSEALARYAWDLGLERVVLFRPVTSSARVDSEAFRLVFESLGGIVPREVVYDSAATFFQTQFETVASVLPDGLFLPLTSRDVQLVAPQFTYYGLDTLGIQLLGTSGWTEDQVVQDVDSRHTDGVIASTTRLSQDETEEYRRFRLRYEELFQKTLRSTVPAYGYDAAGLLLHGLRTNPENRAELLQALELIDDYPGATGHFSVRDGRILRVPQLVRIQNHELIYLDSHFH
jgi:ABC-type branched-subunit amino acid transport system substrate-binding protein